jgi:hypothetical protein
MRAAGGSDLPCSCSGDGVGGSPMYLRQRGKHQWQWRTPAILPRRLVRRGRQHKGVVVAKTVARVRARFGWGKLLRMAPYIGKLVPSADSNPTWFLFWVGPDLVEDHKGRWDFPHGGDTSSVRSRFFVRTMESWPGQPGLLTGHWAVRLAAGKIENGEGKEEAGWAGLRFLLGFGQLPNRNQENPFLF